MHIKAFFVLFSSGIIARPCTMALSIHYRCRGGVYPRSKVQRFVVPDDAVSWSSDFKAYNPTNYTSPHLQGKPYADPNIGDPEFHPQWNSIDGPVDRTSYVKEYNIVESYPLNPIGRTGIRGRGVLGRWGPNHAADPVVTRWKKKENGDIVLNKSSNGPILQFVGIKRGDTGEWALPGGMVDPGEKVAAAAIREFQEEAINSFIMTDDEKQAWKNKFENFFNNGDEVYKGYVDDPRNTDNAWMETIAYNFHDESGEVVGQLKLQAGDDAVGVRWIDVDSTIRLYASHSNIVETVAKKLKSHW